MKEQYDNRLMSSFYLWLDNYILTRGEAFTNVDSNFYHAGDNFNGYYTFSSPFSQFVYDASISGAQIPTGIYLDGNFIGKGEGSFVDYDYSKGYAYFSADITGVNRVSGRFSVKDFNVALTSDPEATILFETKYTLNGKTPQTPTGQADNEISYPAILIRPDGSENRPLAFGGQDLTVNRASVYVMTDSQYKLDAVMSILRDSKNSLVPILDSNDNPFNVFGGFKSEIFNYTGLAAGKFSSGTYATIDKANILKFERNLLSTVKTLNPGVYFGICDISIAKPRYPRQEV